MSIFQWEQNPWGQDILVRISWDLLWLAIIGGVAFVIGHFIYRAKHPPEAAAEPSGAVADAIPEKVVRHTLAARLFHWVMAITVFTLLITAFFPIVGIQFEWLQIHWIAGLVFVAIIIFHIIHATFWMNIRDILITGKDWAEFKLEVQHVLSGKGEGAPKPGKYAVDHRIYHNMVALAGLGVIVSGLLMMVRVDNPIFARNPYLLSDGTWGWVYVLHGLSSVGLVGMIIAHVYFAILPEKRWMTISMIAGWITKKDFLANHDPERWVVTEKASK